MRCWCGYLSGARCRLFACGPADATAIPKPHHLLPHLNPDWFYLSGTSLPMLSWKRGRLTAVVLLLLQLLNGCSSSRRFHPSSDWRAVEACCQPWTWWCSDATALAGYATFMMMMRSSCCSSCSCSCSCNSCCSSSDGGGGGGVSGGCCDAGVHHKTTPKFRDIHKNTGRLLVSSISLNSGYTSRVMVLPTLRLIIASLEVR